MSSPQTTTKKRSAIMVITFAPNTSSTNSGPPSHNNRMAEDMELPAYSITPPPPAHISNGPIYLAHNAHVHTQPPTLGVTFEEIALEGGPTRGPRGETPMKPCKICGYLLLIAVAVCWGPILYGFYVIATRNSNTKSFVLGRRSEASSVDPSQIVWEHGWDKVFSCVTSAPTITATAVEQL
jgi:hypothetical protein